ncbi:DUF3168 domain-containing protein [Rhodalgimonas zhirmunskyi]|uniref:DUF3168 domain-containing protein n=1 Tax=Rhodalgimonas zhirmunskyi TaxID=2964767 RepID=A0AAJ1U9K3_9RHOB|nr:DUF3168 domain-containing protein [Rhodoalgimonas zhirmunskyi]MDQ2092531.1 DUF3168 domain-containing protein [Rhodoalgimonas zhirmunskyi]
MSYGVASALQAAVYQRVSSDPAVIGLVGSAIYDALPPGSLPATYVTLGPENVRDKSDKSGRGALHTITISVVTDSAGFQTAKDVAAAISDALDGSDLTLTRGALIYLNFDRALAKLEGTGAQRRIDLRFRARVEDD